MLDEEALAELSEDLGDAFVPFVARFLDSARGALEEMRGEAATALWSAVAERAHGLKGSAAYLGADELAACLGALQRAAQAQADADAARALDGVAEALDRVAPLLEARTAG